MTRVRVINKVGEAVKEAETTSEMVGQYMYMNFSERGPQFEHYDPAWKGERW